MLSLMILVDNMGILIFPEEFAVHQNYDVYTLKARWCIQVFWYMISWVERLEVW